MIFLSKIFFFISSLLVLNVPFSKVNKPASCLLYKKGKFVQHLVNPNRNMHWITADITIERNDSIETVNTSRIPYDTNFYRIKWISDCSYERKFIRSSLKYNDAERRARGKNYNTDTCTILTTAGKYYICRNRERIDTVWVKELHVTLSEED